MQTKSHAVGWWNLKVLCGLLLVGALIDRYMLFFSSSWFEVPVLMAQALVVIGGALFGWHFWLVRRVNATITEPQLLIHATGLYRWVRHPMYAADLIVFLGLALFLPTTWTLSVLLVSYVALYRQARTEDAYMAQRFGAQHQQWAAETRLLIPGVL